MAEKNICSIKSKTPVGHERSSSPPHAGLLLSRGAGFKRWLLSSLGQLFLLTVTSFSAIAVMFIFYFIIKDALPFFELRGCREFFTAVKWFPSREPPEFGALAIFVGSALVTFGAAVFAVPAGITAAICLSDILPFNCRQLIKPIVEMLAAIPSVAYGFFALVIFAPLLQERGGTILSVAVWLAGAPPSMLAAVVLGDIVASRFSERFHTPVRWITTIAGVSAAIIALARVSGKFSRLEISSGTNALNVSIILGIMALPTIVSVSEDALQAVGRELREGSYALGATRAETLMYVVIPAALPGIFAAVILGIMRAVGETMVVWMASGNAAKIPEPWFNYLEPVRTLTATIAGDMGEADHITGSARYHVLFAMAACLLLISFISNLTSEFIMYRARKKLTGS